MGDDKKAATQTRLALKRMTAGGELKMAKDKGKGAGCYKLASSEKAEKPAPATKAKKPAKKEKKPVATKKAKVTKVTKPQSAAKLKPAAKKSAAKKGKKPAGEKGEEVKKDPVSPFLTFCNLCVETSNESELWIKFWCILSSNFHFC